MIVDRSTYNLRHRLLAEIGLDVVSLHECLLTYSFKLKSAFDARYLLLMHVSLLAWLCRHKSAYVF